MSKLLEAEDPPLVLKKKGRFKLSTSSEYSGILLARGMHKWCHELQICKCEELGHEYNL
jgi:hypothetical protein